MYDVAIPIPTHADTQAGQAATTLAGPGGSPVLTMTPRERFDSLSQDLQEHILTCYRYWHVEHTDWWDCVYEGFRQDMQDKGIDVDDMHFSGFWSQGDGACFEGKVEDWELFLKTAGHDCPALIKHARNYWSFKVSHRGRYYHSNSTRYDADLVLPDYQEDKAFAGWHCPYGDDVDDIRVATWMALLCQYDSEALEREFQELFKSYMDDLYSRLMSEYEHLTSDETILDSLDANDKLEDVINDAIMERDNA